MFYGWEEVKQLGYNIESHYIVGDLEKLNRLAVIHRIGKRRIYRDEKGQKWVKVRGLWWRFPEEVDF